MNLDRHVEAHRDFFRHLVEGDGDSAEKHRDFYDEYLAVMDLTAEFYLQTVETVFIRHALPKGEMTHRGRAGRSGGDHATVALLTIEGENDDISGVGQTKAAHDLCTSIPAEMRAHYLQPRRRPLRRLQRLALPRRDRAAHRRLHRHARAADGANGNGADERQRRRTGRKRHAGARARSTPRPRCWAKSARRSSDFRLESPAIALHHVLLKLPLSTVRRRQGRGNDQLTMPCVRPGRRLPSS